MKKAVLNSLLLGAATFGFAASANAAGVVINFGAANANLNNNYATPPDAAYTAGAGNFTTSLTGTTAASGTNYNTVQQFKDLAAVNVSTTLNLHRTAAKVFLNNTAAFSNTAAVSDMTASVGTFNTTTLAGPNSIITPGAGGSRFDTIALNGLHDGTKSYSDVVFYFAVAAVNNALSSVTVTGGTQTSLEFAGTAGSGFVSTLALSNPAAGQLTLVKWKGSLSAAQTSLTLNLGGDKAGISTIAYVIPEPSSMGLIGLSALGLMVRRRR